jgi:hypothetical protein
MCVQTKEFFNQMQPFIVYISMSVQTKEFFNQMGPMQPFTYFLESHMSATVHGLYIWNGPEKERRVA